MPQQIHTRTGQVRLPGSSGRRGSGREKQYTQRHRNRDRTTEVVAPPPGDYESKTTIISYTK